MGEANRRRPLRDRVLHSESFCIYCGGTNAAETIDHMPPRTIFSGRRRPKGLEFPACRLCNDGARLSEQVAGLLSRMYPDPVDEAGKVEVKKILYEAENNLPGLLLELFPGSRQSFAFRRPGTGQQEVGNVLRVNGPLVTSAMNTFSAKLGLALHFNQTSKIIPPSGATAVRWFSNIDAIQGGIPDDILRLVGPPRTLEQGKFHTGEQFRYGSRASEDGGFTAHFASFRFSFSVVAFVSDCVDDLHHAPILNVFRPGFLRGPSESAGRSS